MWEAIIGSSVTPEQVLLCMAALKIARQAGAHDQDNIDDAAGYLSLIPELQADAAVSAAQRHADEWIARGQREASEAMKREASEALKREALQNVKYQPPAGGVL